jgi:hypothetical protein
MGSILLYRICHVHSVTINDGLLTLLNDSFGAGGWPSVSKKKNKTKQKTKNLVEWYFKFTHSTTHYLRLSCVF